MCPLRCHPLPFPSPAPSRPSRSACSSSPPSPPPSFARTRLAPVAADCPLLHCGKLRRYKFLRFIFVVLGVKAVEKGFRALKEEHLHDYNLRKANIAAAEKALWDEELALHAVDTRAAESSVQRQRLIDWQFRSQPAAHAKIMHKQMMTFVATDKLA